MLVALVAVAAGHVGTAAGAVPSLTGSQWDAERAAVLERINEARTEHGLAPYRRDAVLERVGDQHCRDLIVLGGTGHFSTEGTPPYLRALLAGVTGFHRENVAAYDSTVPVPPERVRTILLDAVQAMLGEVPPDDGHRRTILDPVASRIGIGIAVEDGTVRMAHEVATDVVRVAETVPAASRPLSPMRVAGRLDPRWQLAAVEVLWEPLPAALSVEDARAIRSYRYPPRRSMTTVAGRRRGSSAEHLTVDDGGSFAFRWRTGPEDGVEIVVLWAAPKGVQELAPVGAEATVVTGDGRLPGALSRWRALAPDGG